MSRCLQSRCSPVLTLLTTLDLVLGNFIIAQFLSVIVTMPGPGAALTSPLLGILGRWPLNVALRSINQPSSCCFYATNILCLCLVSSVLRGNGVVPAHVSFIGQMSDMRTQHNQRSRQLTTAAQQQHNSSRSDLPPPLQGHEILSLPLRAERDSRHAASLPSLGRRQPPAPHTRGCPGSCQSDKTGCLFCSLIYYLQHL